MSRSIVVAYAKNQVDAGHISKADYKKIIQRPRGKTERKPRDTEQTRKARELQQRANVPQDRPCNLNDITAFEEILNVQILVVNNTKETK